MKKPRQKLGGCDLGARMYSPERELVEQSSHAGYAVHARFLNSRRRDFFPERMTFSIIGQRPEKETHSAEKTDGDRTSIFGYVHTTDKIALSIFPSKRYTIPMNISSLLANPLLLGFIILCVATLILLGLVIWMYLKLRRFLIPLDASHIGESLTHVTNNLDELQKFRAELESYLATVEKRLRKSVQSVHTMRFNPFHGTGGGGKQSFATTLLNEDGDGVIISSLYARDHVSVFGKPVRKHASEYELSEEEQESLDHAKKGLTKSI